MMKKRIFSAVLLSAAMFAPAALQASAKSATASSAKSAGASTTASSAKSKASVSRKPRLRTMVIPLLRYHSPV